MKNKYQDALEHLKHADKFFYNLNPLVDGYTHVNNIQELVDKTIPNKVKIIKPYCFEKPYTTYNCPICNKEFYKSWCGEHNIYKPKYCSDCGQAIDWSNIDE